MKQHESDIENKWTRTNPELAVNLMMSSRAISKYGPTGTTAFLKNILKFKKVLAQE
jgi:hypothetical protein